LIFCRIQDKYWEEDGFIEEANIQPLIINMQTEDSDEEDEGETESDSDDELGTETDTLDDNDDDDEVEYGGSIIITECLESGEQFRLERELQQFMIDGSQRGRGRGRGRGRVACRARGGGRRLFM